MSAEDPLAGLIIHRATRSNIDVITEFNLLGAKESAGRDLDADQVRAGVIQVIKGHPDFYMLAKVGGKYIAQLKVHHHWYDWYDSLFWWIEHVYVEPPFRRMGVSQKLIAHVKQLALESGEVRWLLLHVSGENPKAIASYEKAGFKQSKLFPMVFEVKST